MSEYVGFDVSKEETSYCVMNQSGKILAHGKALRCSPFIGQVWRRFKLQFGPADRVYSSRSLRRQDCRLEGRV